MNTVGAHILYSYPITSSSRRTGPYNTHDKEARVITVTGLFQLRRHVTYAQPAISLSCTVTYGFVHCNE